MDTILHGHGMKTSRAAAPSANGPRVLLAGGLGAMSAPGGGEVQMLATARALSQIGLRARLWRPWEDRLADVDCLHLFGSLPEHIPLVESARVQGVRVLLSTIAWFDLGGYWRGAETFAGSLLAAGRFTLRTACPALPSWRRRLYHGVDMLLPNSNAEARQLTRLFQVPAERIHVVPNGADARFASADPGPFVEKYGQRDFVLSVGRIEPRKNQLGLLRALKGTDMSIVIIGDPVPGHEAYYSACRQEAGPNVRFIGHIAHDGPLLASAYGACRCLALPSWFETPGLVAIEAAMSGVPLVLPRAGSAREYFGGQALYVRPGKPAEIRHAVQTAFDAGRDAAFARRVREQFTWRAVAMATQYAYDKSHNGRRRLG